MLRQVSYRHHIELRERMEFICVVADEHYNMPCTLRHATPKHCFFNGVRENIVVLLAGIGQRVTYRCGVNILTCAFGDRGNNLIRIDRIHAFDNDSDLSLGQAFIQKINNNLLFINHCSALLI